MSSPIDAPSNSSPPSSSDTPSEPSPRNPAAEALILSVLYHTILEKGQDPPKQLGIPVKQAYPEDWNWHFQRTLRQKYGPNADLKAWQDENFDLDLMGYMDNLHVCNMHIAMTSKQLLEMEGLLVGLAMEELVHGDFEAKWAALGLEKNKEIVLDGLIRGAFRAREKSRFDCPEMCLLGLVGDGEYSLVNLLKAIVAHDPTTTLRLKSIYLFSHPAVEREWALYSKDAAPDFIRAFAHLRILQRNHFIVQTLIGILDAYAGKPAPKISLNEEYAKANEPNCCACGVISSEKYPVTLKRCSGCKVMWYCSKACQNRDWSEHKKLCGLRSEKFDPALVTATPDALVPAEFIGCPAPEAGFVRSPALWRQIYYLSKKDSYDRDYHFDTTPNCTRSVQITDPILRLMFFVARRRAMTSGDPTAVHKMHNILQSHQRMGLFNLTADQIRGQLEREYRIVLSGPGVGVGALPTPQEMVEEMRYMYQRDRLAGKQADADEEWKKGAMADVESEWEKENESELGSDDIPGSSEESDGPDELLAEEDSD